MKILQLCNKVPYPEKDGGAIGISVFTKALLKSGHEIKMLAMNTSKHFVNVDSIPEKFRKDTGLETVKLDTSIKPVKALLTLLKNESYNISRFLFSEFEHKLTTILKNETFDIIQLEGLYLTPYIKTIRAASLAPIILREHNVEWLIWERLAEEENIYLKKKYLATLTAQLRKYEANTVNLCDGITTTTVNDMQRLKDMGCKIPIAHIPFGIDTSLYKTAVPEKKASLFYIGALDWLPNIQGIEWFLEQVWPSIHAAYPTLEFHVAGRNMPEKYKTATIPGVIFHGEVDSATSFMNAYDIMLIPLLAGSGVRVKIIEGMAMQKPIITTGIGIEGIECNYESDVMIANTPGELLTALKQCLENPIFAENIAVNGKKYVEANHNITSITNKLVTFYNDIISKKIAAN